MKRRVPSLILGVLLILVLAYAASFRKELTTLPRLRVGPLATSAAAKPTMRFYALGDTGSGDESQYRVAAAMEARCRATGGADGIFLLGDNSYQAGFASIDDPDWEQKIWKPYGSDCLKQMPIYPVLGNHDYKGNPQAQIDYTLVNTRWRFPNRFYSVQFGDLAQVVAFDSEMSEVCFRPQYCSVDFLFDQLGKGEPTWRIVIAHHPLKSSSDHGFGHTGGLRGVLLAPLLCDRADFWLAGHAHHLEHLKPEGCRLDLFVSGGGGGELYETVEGVDESRFARGVNGFLEMELSATESTSRFFGADGALLYEMKKPAQPR